jgi:hypothetical protein
VRFREAGKSVEHVFLNTFNILMKEKINEVGQSVLMPLQKPLSRALRAGYLLYMYYMRL